MKNIEKIANEILKSAKVDFPKKMRVVKDFIQAQSHPKDELHVKKNLDKEDWERLKANYPIIIETKSGQDLIIDGDPFKHKGKSLAEYKRSKQSKSLEITEADMKTLLKEKIIRITEK